MTHVAHPSVLHLAVQYAGGTGRLPERHQLRRWVRATLAVIAPRAATEITLRFVGEREGRTLNRTHRGRDYATNVLTFDLHEDLPDGGADPIVADIAICVPVVAREAREQRKRFIDHCAHMVVHGVLHAHGFDHGDDDEAQRMETVERTVLTRFRITDPYAR